MSEAQIHVSQSLPALSPEGDIAASLPAPVRKKFKALRVRAENERATFLSVSEKRSALKFQIQEFEGEIEAMTLRIGTTGKFGHSGRGLTEDSSEVRRARMQLASMREDSDDIDAIYSDGTRTLSPLVERLTTFLQRRRTAFPPIEEKTVLLRKGETVQTAIENRRRRLQELAADIVSVKRSPWPTSITKKLARAQIAELCKRGRPDVFGLVEHGERIAWPTLPTGAVDLPEAVRNPIDTPALIAWALGSELIEAIEREIDELSDDDRALTHEERGKKIETIEADMLAIEREEEALIELAEAQGVPITRRVNADPRAVLGVG